MTMTVNMKWPRFSQNYIRYKFYAIVLEKEGWTSEIGHRSGIPTHSTTERNRSLLKFVPRTRATLFLLSYCTVLAELIKTAVQFFDSICIAINHSIVVRNLSITLYNFILTDISKWEELILKCFMVKHMQ